MTFNMLLDESILRLMPDESEQRTMPGHDIVPQCFLSRRAEGRGMTLLVSVTLFYGEDNDDSEEISLVDYAARTTLVICRCAGRRQRRGHAKGSTCFRFKALESASFREIFIDIGVRPQSKLFILHAE